MTTERGKPRGHERLLRFLLHVIVIRELGVNFLADSDRLAGKTQPQRSQPSGDPSMNMEVPTELHCYIL